MSHIIIKIIILFVVLLSSYGIYYWWHHTKVQKTSLKFAIVQQALENTNFRKVIATTTNSQVVVMSITPGSQIGEEIHPTTDQLLFFVKGKASGILNGEKIDIAPQDLVIVPAGTKHNIINTGTEDLKLYTVYTPPIHKPTTIHVTKMDAEKDTQDTYVPQEKNKLAP